MENESSDVQTFFESQNLNSTAFTELSTLMTDLGGDEVEIVEYFEILFNNTDAISLLVASVGTESSAQEAVIDALEGNAEVYFLFIIIIKL